MDTPNSSSAFVPPKPDRDGNYSSPALIALGRAWEDYCSEVVEEDQVVAVISEVGNFAFQQLRQLERQMEQGVSDPKNESFSQIYDAFQILFEGCEYMSWEFSEDVPEDVEEPEEGFFAFGYEMVQEATNQMVAGHNKTMAHIEAMAEVSCPFCRHCNLRGTPKCDNCGRALSFSTDSSMNPSQQVNLLEQQGLEQEGGPAGEFTRNYVLTAQLLEAWKAGAVSPEKVSSFLEDLETNFTGHLRETEVQESKLSSAPDLQKTALLEALETTRRGLEMSLQAIETMQQAFDKEDDRFLFFGLTELAEASKVLIEAYWQNKNAAAL